MNKYAVIDGKTNIVWGVIKWDGAPLNMNKAPFINRMLVRTDKARPGDIFNPETHEFTTPIPVNPDGLGEALAEQE